MRKLKTLRKQEKSLLKEAEEACLKSGFDLYHFLAGVEWSLERQRQKMRAWRAKFIKKSD